MSESLTEAMNSIPTSHNLEVVRQDLVLRGGEMKAGRPEDQGHPLPSATQRI